MTLPPSVQLYVSTVPVDLRRSFDGLSLYVQSVLCRDPLSGHLFVFFNRRKDQVSILMWDRSGYALYRKRLERGRFRLPAEWSERVVGVEAAELLLVLEGIDLSRAKRRARWQRGSVDSQLNPEAERLG